MNEVSRTGHGKDRMLSINDLPGGVGVYELGDEIIAIYLSRGLSKLLAYTPKEFHNYNELDLLDSVHEKERKRIKAVFQKLKRSHKELDVVFRLERKEDRFIRLLGRYSRHHGQFPVYCLVASDVSEAHQNALALERQNTRLQFAFSHSTLEMWEYHLEDDRLVPLSRTILGGHAPLEISNPAAFLLEEGYIHPDFSVTLNHDFTQLQAGNEPDSILFVRSAAGSFRWLRLSYAFLSDGEQERRRAIGIFQDVHDEIAMRQQVLGEDKAFFGGFNLDSGKAVLADNRVWKMMDGCDDFYTMYDSVMQKAIPKDYLAVFQEIDSSEKLKHFVEAGKKELAIEAKMMHPLHREDGYRWVRFHFNVSIANNITIGYIAIKDIEKSKVQEQALEKQAHSDSLTGVYNRSSLEELVTRYLIDGGNSAFFLIDIDRFKMINDTYGHDLGDRVLKRMASLMRMVFPQGTIIGRLGGDEFVAFIPQMTEAGKSAGDEFCHRIAEDRTLGILFTCSLGFCISPEDGTTFSELYQHADLALYHSKNHGRNQCTHYVPEMGMHKTLCWTNHEWMLDNFPDIVCLIDLQNYDLLFLNKTGREIHSRRTSYIGKKCYEVIFHRTQVCEHCRFHSLSYDSYSFWQQADTFGNVWLFKEKLILFNEKPAKLVILVDQLKQARQIAEKSVTQPKGLHLSRPDYFKLLQRGGSSWDYDVNQDVLTLSLFMDGQPYGEQVHGFLKCDAGVKAMLAEERLVFREALRKRISKPEGMPLQVRLTVSSGSSTPVLFSWYYMDHRMGGNVVCFSPSGYVFPESPLKEIIQHFAVALLHLAWEHDTVTLLMANRKFHEIFNSGDKLLEKDPLGWLLPSERDNLLSCMRSLQENHLRGETCMVIGHDNRYFSLTCQLGTCYGYVQMVTIILQDVSRE
jgi:diguanylate cyclase (GGDEF)-like protein